MNYSLKSTWKEQLEERLTNLKQMLIDELIDPNHLQVTIDDLELLIGHMENDLKIASKAN